MKLTGYGDFDWEPPGYSFVFEPENFVPSVAVEPVIIPRPGTYAAFGISVVNQMTLPGGFLLPSNIPIETSQIDLLKRLNPANVAPRELRATRNDGTKIKIQAVIQIAGISFNEDINMIPVNFVCVQPFWLATVVTTGSGSV